jgi:hypothetical protein
MGTGLFYCETPLEPLELGYRCLAYFHAQDPPLRYGAQARHTTLLFHLTRSRISQEKYCVNRRYKTDNFRVNSVKIKQENRGLYERYSPKKRAVRDTASHPNIRLNTTVI